MHNAEIFEKVMKNSFKKKQYTLPSGTILIYQGYENIAFNELMKEMKESDFTNDVKLMPKFTYQFGGKSHRYYPDLYIPSQKKIIEVKSPYTYNNQLEQNHCKKDQVVQDGYTFEFWICEKTKIITDEAKTTSIVSGAITNSAIVRIKRMEKSEIKTIEVASTYTVIYSTPRVRE